jgi:SAM-dependent methyltransferase
MKSVAEFYGNHHSRDKVYDFESFRDSYKRYISHLPADYDLRELKILEAGGVGGKAVSFQTNGATAYHIDIVEQGVAWSGGLGVASTLGSILDSHPEYEDKFDIVICDGVIHHTENPTLSLMNLTRWVKSGGVIYLSFYESDSLYHLVVEYGRKIIAQNNTSLQQIDELFTAHSNKEFVRTQKRNFLDDLFVPIYGSTTRTHFFANLAGLTCLKINSPGLNNHKIEVVLRKDSDASLSFEAQSPAGVLGINLKDMDGSPESILEAAFIFYQSCYLRSFRARLSCVRRDHDDPFLPLSTKTPRSYFIYKARKLGLI